MVTLVFKIDTTHRKGHSFTQMITVDCGISCKNLSEINTLNFV